MMPPADSTIELFSTCPPLDGREGPSYLAQALEVARWSERLGCRGILVYADNSQLDPWLLSQLIIQNTRALCPLVAVQPVYMHPYTVAKMVATIGRLHGRRVYLNLVAGGFRNDLLALNDATPHDERYGRLAEYALIIKRLLADEGPVSFDGRYYKVDGLKLAPRLPPALHPGIFVSGSSPAGMAAARALGATAICYPKPLQENREPLPDGLASGVRIGVLCREDDAEAWALAEWRFPEDRKGRLTRQLADKVSDSAWHKQLAEKTAGAERRPYWLAPFRQYQTSCPYLVGDYARVGRELSGYMNLGYRTYILDVPPDAEELVHIRMAFDYAIEEELACRKRCTTG